MYPIQGATLQSVYDIPAGTVAVGSISDMPPHVLEKLESGKFLLRFTPSENDVPSKEPTGDSGNN